MTRLKNHVAGDMTRHSWLETRELDAPSPKWATAGGLDIGMAGRLESAVAG